MRDLPLPEAISTPTADAEMFALQHETGSHVPGETAIWVFILGDMCMFAFFFGQFVFDRAHQVELFNRSQLQLNIYFGAINTLILLTGSLFVVLGVEASKRQVSNAGSTYFVLALLCAGAFGLNKVVEYWEKLKHGMTPNTNDFFMYYYVYTGIHALHLLIGCGFLFHMWRMSQQSQRSVAELRFIETGASYWHLVDLLWVVLFALLYLLN